MITLYKKVEKCKEHPTGYKEIQAEELDKPFLFCISAQDIVDRSIYGIIREGAQGARVYTTQENAAGFKIDEMPVDFLGVRYELEKDKKNDKALELVEKVFHPFLIKKGLGIDDLIHQARLMNFMTYCDGTMTYKDIEKYLEEKLKQDGIKDEDINQVLSQISLVAIGTMVDTRNCKGTTFTFVDVKDDEIYNEKTEVYEGLLQKHGKNGIYGTNGKKNNGLYIYHGNGNHSLKEYFSDKNMVKPVLCFVLSRLLQSSIEQKPISLAELMADMKPYADEGKSVKELMSLLDSNISYGDVSKYTEGEATIRRELDETYSSLAKAAQAYESEKVSRKKVSSDIQNIIQGIREYSSDMTFYQILCSAHMWQAPSGVDPFRELSDRQIREKIEELGLVPGRDIKPVDSQEPVTDGPKL